MCTRACQFYLSVCLGISHCALPSGEKQAASLVSSFFSLSLSPSRCLRRHHCIFHLFHTLLPSDTTVFGNKKCVCVCVCVKSKLVQSPYLSPIQLFLAFFSSQES